MNRVTVLFCVYLHNPSLPWPSYTSQSLHFYAPPPLLGSCQCCVLLPCHSLFFFFSILSACYINDTRVTEGKSSSTRRHHHHHRVNLIVTLDTQFVRIIFKFVSHRVTFLPPPPRLSFLAPPLPHPTLGPEILCWYFAGMGGSRGLGLALGLRSRGFTLLFCKDWLYN